MFQLAYKKLTALQHNVFSTGIHWILAKVLLPSHFCLGSGCQGQYYSHKNLTLHSIYLYVVLFIDALSVTQTIQC
jgi:hypothetical protein